MRRSLSRCIVSGSLVAGTLWLLGAPAAVAQVSDPGSTSYYYYPAPASPTPSPGYYYYPAPVSNGPRPGYYYVPARVSTNQPAGYYYYPSPNLNSPPPGRYYYNVSAPKPSPPAAPALAPAMRRGVFGVPRLVTPPHRPGDDDDYAYKS